MAITEPLLCFWERIFSLIFLTSIIPSAPITPSAVTIMPSTNDFKSRFLSDFSCERSTGIPFKLNVVSVILLTMPCSLILSPAAGESPMPPLLSAMTWLASIIRADALSPVGLDIALTLTDIPSVNMAGSSLAPL